MSDETNTNTSELLADLRRERDEALERIAELEDRVVELETELAEVRRSVDPILSRAIQARELATKVGQRETMKIVIGWLEAARDALGANVEEL